MAMHLNTVCCAAFLAYLVVPAAALLPHRPPTGSLAPVRDVYASRLTPSPSGGALVGGYLSLNGFAPLSAAQVRSHVACGPPRS